MGTLWKKTKAGFTLIELMVVVAIIGILASVAIVSFVNYIRKTKVAEVGEILDRCYKGLVDYYDRSYALASGTTQATLMPPDMTTPIGPAHAGGASCDPVQLTGGSGFVPAGTFTVGSNAQVLKALKWVFDDAIYACYNFRSDKPGAAMAAGDHFYCEAWTDVDNDDIPAHWVKMGTYMVTLNAFQAGSVWHDDASDDF